MSIIIDTSAEVLSAEQIFGVEQSKLTGYDSNIYNSYLTANKELDNIIKDVSCACIEGTAIPASKSKKYFFIVL